MRRWLLVAALLLVTVVFMASKCAGQHGTKIWVANWTENPFHANGSAQIIVGGSLDVLTLSHGATENINIQRNSATLVTLIVKSLVDANSTSDWEAAIRVTESIPGQFKAVPDAPDIITVTLQYPTP